MFQLTKMFVMYNYISEVYLTCIENEIFVQLLDAVVKITNVQLKFLCFFLKITTTILLSLVLLHYFDLGLSVVLTSFIQVLFKFIQYQRIL